MTHPLRGASVSLQMLSLAKILVLDLLRVRRPVIQCEFEPKHKVRSNVLLIRIIPLRQPIPQLDRHISDVVQLSANVCVAKVSSSENGFFRDPRLLLLSQTLVIFGLVEENEPNSVVFED